MATIKVYGRIHPSSTNPSSLVDVQERRLLVSKSSRGSSFLPRNATEIGFTFDHIFNKNSTQKDIFDNVAKDIVDKFLEGYNGTVFAYGQTGSGKTYTIEGEELNRARSPSHGLVPQALAYLFKEIDNLKDECATVKISFLEVYNETVYDLLGPLIYGTKSTRDLPKVLVSQGSGGSCHLHGLSIHDVSTEFDARKLHLNGRNNQAVASTSSNDKSSRSHAIFTIFLTRQKHDSELIVKSKLNLVDLAGSESLSVKKNRSMSMNTETKHINLSLHYLETVIVALQRIRLKGIQPIEEDKDDGKRTGKRCQSAHIPPQHRFNTEIASSLQGLKCPSAMSFYEMSRKRSSIVSVSPYIPYRNSLLTMLLQDSLGGNCNTVMIATLSMETCNINETISTCRFAQRVARVTNNPIINKTINEEAMIRKLQSKVAKLTKELEMVKQNGVYEDNSLPTTKEEQSVVIDVIHSYLDGQIKDPVQHGINDSQKIRTCLAYLKDLVIQTKQGRSDPDEKDSGVGTGSLPTNNSEDEPYSPTLSNGSGTSTNVAVAGSSISNIANQTTKPQLKERNTHSASSSQHFFPSPANSPELDKHLDNRSESSSIINEELLTERNIHSSLSCEGVFTTPANSTENLEQLKSMKSATRAGSMDHEHRKSRPTSSHQSCASQRALSSCTPVKRNGQGVIEESLKKLKLLELELEKEKLIHKSKLLSTALSNQKARILIMDKRGCPLDEIDNERLAEQQLRGKQADVEKRLSVIVKQIVDTKSVDNAARLGGKEIVLTRESEREVLMRFEKKLPDEHALKFHNLRLKQQSARQKLLACREKLMPFLLPEVMKPESPNIEENLPGLNREISGRSRITCQYPPVKTNTELNSPEGNFNSQRVIKKASKSETSHGIRTEAKPSKKSLARVCSAYGRRGILIDSKQKDTPGRILGQSFRKSQVTTEKSRRRIGLSSAANREHQASIITAQSYFKKGNTFQHLKKDVERKTQSMKASVGSMGGSSVARYELEHGKGFIVCRDSKVYQHSNFKNDDLSLIGARMSQSFPMTDRPDSQRTCDITSQWERQSEAQSLSRSCSSTGSDEGMPRSSNESPLNGRDDTTRSSPDGEHYHKTTLSSQGSGSVDKTTPFGGDTGDVKRPISSRENKDRDETTRPPFPANTTTTGSCTNETLPPLPKKPNIQLKVSPSVLKARKQQLERAKRIREVTNAVEIIQAAFRRYQCQKKG